MENGYASVHELMDAKKMDQVLNGDLDWAINPIIADIKKLVLNFAHVKVLFYPYNSYFSSSFFR